MRKLYFFIVTIIILSSCKSSQKMLEQGNYDRALDMAISKVAGKKKKDDKYVKQIEIAFLKSTKDDLDKISFLKNEKSGNYWSQVLNILEKIDDRQRKVDPLIPLQGAKGYKANFNFLNVNPLIAETRNNAADYEYNLAKNLINNAEKGDKKAAILAYEKCNDVERYITSYKDIVLMRNRAYDLGLNHVLIKVVNTSDIILPKRFYDEVSTINTNDLNRKWYRFYTNVEDHNGKFDYLINLNMRNIEISPEKEKEREYEEKASVKDGFEYERDKDGKIKRDSLGKEIKKDKFTEVKAWVTELYRYKGAFVRGDILIKDNANSKSFNSVPVNVEAKFESYASKIRGDKRAISDNTKNRMRSYPEPFPSNEQLLLMSINDLKKLLYDEIDHNLKDY